MSKSPFSDEVTLSGLQLLPYGRDGEPHGDDSISDDSLEKHTLNGHGIAHVLYPTLFASLVLLAAVPIALLAGLSPRFSEALGENACLPSGQFVLPYTSNIWDFQQFFAITLPFTGGARLDCNDDGTESAAQACTGYTFTQVKVIDLAWDFLLGRCGQALLALMAHRLFRTVLDTLMQSGEVGYDMFASVAFAGPTFLSLGPLARHIVGQTPVPRTRHATQVYAVMGLCVLYLVSMPTLFSAMTGYTSYYVPFIKSRMPGSVIMSETNITDCQDAFVPAWGVSGDVPVNGDDDGPRFSMLAISYTADEYDWMDCKLYSRDCRSTCQRVCGIDCAMS